MNRNENPMIRAAQSLALLWCAVSPAFAADIHVNSTADGAIDALPGNGICETIPGNGVCTLRAAVMEANAAAGHDTIFLQAGALYVLTRPNPIGPAEDLVGAGGDLDLVNDDVTINGNGATIDGNATERVFHLAGDIAVDLSNLTVRNGLDVHGGGIYGGGQVTMTNCTVTGNSTTGHGGGIYATGTWTMTGCTISANDADGSGGGIFAGSGSHVTLNSSFVLNNEMNGTTSRGAGIYSQGTLIANDSQITGNQHTTAGNNDGGGIANASGPATLTRCIVNNNTSQSQGGGIWNAGMLTLSATTVSGNSSLGIKQDGYSGTNVSATIEDSTISNNSGGGIDNQRATLTVRRSVIENNPTGSGVFNQSTSEVTLEATTVRGHTSSIGAGLVNYAMATIRQGCVFSNNHCNSGSGGGGMYNFGTLEVSETLLAGNSAPSGGGIQNVSGGNLTVDDSEFVNNTASSWGAGINNDYRSTITVRGTVFRGNSGPSRGGGINTDNTATIERCAFFDNSAGRAGQGNVGGGGFFMSNHASGSITNSTFSANRAVGEGGGIQNQGDLTLTHVTFADNIASSLGEAIYQNTFAGGITISSSIVSATTVGRACVGAASFTSAGYNIGTDTTCALNHVSDMPSTDPLLGPLGEHGGNTLTHYLRHLSPAIDRRDDGTCSAMDQRSYGRPADGDGDEVSRCDIGAFEQQFVDCNENLILDSIDIANGTLVDNDDNGVPDVCEIPFDVNGDGVITLADYGAMNVCFSGPDQVLLTGCGLSDFDGDGDSDLLDFGDFQMGFTEAQ